jgi:hypothetical protein
LKLLSGEDGKPRVRILDPEYPQFLDQLTKQAFAR